MMYRGKILKISVIGPMICLIVWGDVFSLSAGPWNLKHYEQDWLKHGYTKFSDFIGKLKVDKQYRYVEDFLELYRFSAYYGEKDMLRNIANLRFARELKFRSPYQALCKIPNERYSHKYRLLVFMHIHVLLTRNFLRIGSHYDKNHIRFYDVSFGHYLSDSLKIAELWYTASEAYWQEALKYARQAAKIPVDLDCGFLENELYEIRTRELDLGNMRKIYLYKLKQKQEKLAERMKHIPREKGQNLDMDNSF